MGVSAVQSHLGQLSASRPPGGNVDVLLRAAAGEAATVGLSEQHPASGGHEGLLLATQNRLG